MLLYQDQLGHEKNKLRIDLPEILPRLFWIRMKSNKSGNPPSLDMIVCIILEENENVNDF